MREQAYAGQMQVFGDYHLHTSASDGRCSVFAHAKKAKELSVKQIAITDHSFASFLFCMTRKKFARQQMQIAKCDGIEVLQGIEANIINENGDIDVPDDIIRQSGVLHIGFHRFLSANYVFRAGKWLLTNGYASKKRRQKLVEKNTQAYINALRKYPVDCVVHLNHRALVDVKRVCEVAKETGAYVELNAKHLDALDNVANDLIESGVNLLVGTDTHSQNHTADIQKVINFVLKHNIPLSRVFGLNENKPTFKDKSLWHQ